MASPSWYIVDPFPAASQDWANVPTCAGLYHRPLSFVSSLSFKPATPSSLYSSSTISIMMSVSLAGLSPVSIHMHGCFHCPQCSNPITIAANLNSFCFVPNLWVPSSIYSYEQCLVLGKPTEFVTGANLPFLAEICIFLLHQGR